MKFNNKIKNYRPEVDVEAWHAMENLLDNTTLNKAATGEQGLLNKFKRWIFVILLGVGLVASSVYVMHYNTANDAIHSEALELIPEQSNANSGNEEEIDTTNNDNSRLNKDILDGKDFNTSRNEKTDDVEKTSSKIKKENSSELIPNNRGGNSNSQNRTRYDANVQDNVNHFISKRFDNSTQQVSKVKSNLQSTPHTSKYAINRDEERSNENSEMTGENSKSKQNTSQSISESSSLELSSENDSNLLSEVDNETKFDALLKVEKLSTKSLDELYPISKPVLKSPELIKPKRIPSRYLIGLDIGNATYFNRVSGESISLFGVYEVWSWLRVGLKFNRTSMRDPTNYSISPEIKQRKSETSFKFYTQIVPLRLWRFNLGIDGAYGITDITEKNRLLLNPEPNVIDITEQTASYLSSWFYLGAHLTFDISQSIKIGATLGTDTGTESTHFSGRIVYRI